MKAFMAQTMGNQSNCMNIIFSFIFITLSHFHVHRSTMWSVCMKQGVIIACNNLAFHTSSAEPAAPDMRKDEYEFHIRALIPVSLRYTPIQINGSFSSHVVMSIFSNNVRGCVFMPFYLKR